MIKYIVKERKNPVIRNKVRLPGETLPDPRNEHERGGYEALCRNGDITKVTVIENFKAPVTKPTVAANIVTKRPSWQQK